MVKDKGDKKRKRPSAVAETKVVEDGEVAAGPSGFSLFGGSAKSGELDDVFGKSASFARPETAKPLVLPLPTMLAAAPAEASSSSRKKATKAKAAVEAPAETDSGDNDDPALLRDAEALPKPSAVKMDAPIATPIPPVLPPNSDEDSDDDEVDLVHESLKVDYKPPKKKEKKKAAYIPPDETSENRDRRTIFIGNLPIEVAKSKSALHQLRSHILSFAPSAKIESVRFRSVAFATPTAALPGEDDDGKRAKREKERAAAWRDHQATVGKGAKGKEAEELDTSKTFLDAKGKRKVAFIKKDFHEALESCNAYVVFEHPHPDRSANVAPVMNPYEAATAALKANGTTFMDRTIRVDALHSGDSAGTGSSKRNDWLPQGANPRLSLFVGGLDYAAKEEDVRVFFEELIKSERGKAAKGEKYVVGVRIVRDKETQLGKGFGYLHLADRESVDELLAVEPSKLKFAKKQLRLQRSKALPPTAKTAAAASASTSGTTKPDAASKAKAKVSASKPASTPAAAKRETPKGNPLLGERLKDLSKEERKVAKMADADRQARRLAKKKMSMKVKKDTGAVKLSASKSERERSKSKVKAKKGRGRSAAQIAKMKGART